MQARPYDIIKDFLEVSRWRQARGLSLGSALETLPKNGVVIYENDDAVAMGFIRLVEGGFGQIDSYITNPAMPASIRDAALDYLTTQVIEKAKELKLKGLIGTSSDKNTLLRSLRHGFIQQDATVIALDLSS